MNQSDFKDLDLILSRLKKQNFKITKFVWFKTTADDPSTLYARDSHNILKPWITCNVFPTNMNYCDYNEIPALYSELVPISNEKKKDLLDMIHYLTNDEHVSFYDSLPTT